MFGSIETPKRDVDLMADGLQMLADQSGEPKVATVMSKKVYDSELETLGFEEYIIRAIPEN